MNNVKTMWPRFVALIYATRGRLSYRRRARLSVGLSDTRWY